jgi:D-aspartate ligase
MLPFKTSVPVVVLRPVNHGSLCLVRTLGRMGVKVYAVGDQPRSAGMMSRYCHGKFITNGNVAGRGALVEFLRDVSRRIGQRPILTCTDDDSSAFIADHADALREAFLFPIISSQLVRTLTDKKQMYFLARRLGVPTAETSFPKSRRDALDLIQDNRVRFPIMLKGIDGNLLERRGKPKMVIVRDAQELLRKYDEIEDPANPNLMFQEYIPGGDDSVWMFNGYFGQNSHCMLGFTGQKLRQHPVYVGATSLGICLRNEVVEKTTKDFMKAIDYRGVLDIGYRYDARDGQYKVLDVNPRVGATFRLFLATNGMDVVRAMYLDLTGQPVPSAPTCEGRKWVVEKGDLISFRHYRRDGKLKFVEWVRSFRGVQEAAWFATDDFVPFALMCLELSGQAIRWLAKFLWRRDTFAGTREEPSCPKNNR